MFITILPHGNLYTESGRSNFGTPQASDTGKPPHPHFATPPSCPTLTDHR